MTEPCPLLGSKWGLSASNAFERGVGTVALVAIAADFFGADYCAGLLVEHRFGDFHGRDFAGEEAFLLGAGGALLADQGIFVLGLAADLVALGDDLGGFAHHHVDAGILLFDRGAGIVVANDEADGFHAAADGGLGAFTYDLVSCHGDGLQTGRAEAVHRDSGGRNREAGVQRRNARDVVALHSVGLAAAQNHVFDFFGIELRGLAQDILDAMGGEVLGPRHVEGAAKRFGKAGARTGYYDGFSHLVVDRLVVGQLSWCKTSQLQLIVGRNRRRCGLQRPIFSAAGRAPRVRHGCAETR